MVFSGMCQTVQMCYYWNTLLIETHVPLFVKWIPIVFQVQIDEP